MNTSIIELVDESRAFDVQLLSASSECSCLADIDSLKALATALTQQQYRLQRLNPTALSPEEIDTLQKLRQLVSRLL